MIERLEVTPGPGTVIRFGSVAAWASSSASAGLISFLSESARNLAPSPVSGDQVADHLVAVLQRRDPEPHVPFVVIGPSEEGWTALLHGPVQVWDGASWTTPSPHPGWLRASMSPKPALSVAVSGTPVPALSPDSMWDLGSGVVPGGGFILMPAVPSAAAIARPLEETTVLAGPEAGPPTEVLPAGGIGAAAPAAAAAATAAAAAGLAGTRAEPAEPVPVVPVEGPAGSEAADDGGPGHDIAEQERAEQDGAEQDGAGQEGAGQDRSGRQEAGEQSPAALAAAGAARSAGAPAGVVDLRSPEARSRVVPYPPLPPAGDPPRPVAGAPVVAGFPCPRGHLNRPGMPACARCGRPIGDAGGYQVSGTRPALGCLIADNGSVYRLDSGYLVGSDPVRDPTVRGRLARPLVLDGDDVAVSHAEIRLHDWDVVVTDRASEGGTHVFEPGASSWERLRPYQPRVLQPGTHLAFGQRVATFVSPWTPGADGASAQETSGRY